MPDGFFRSNESIGLDIIGGGINYLFQRFPIQPGRNQGVGNYILDPTSANFSEFCLLSTNFVNQTVRSLYPAPTGILLDRLNANLDNFYSPLLGQGCPQFFPYGQPY